MLSTSDQAELGEAVEVVFQRSAVGDEAVAEAVDGDLVDVVEAASRGWVAEPGPGVGGGAGEPCGHSVGVGDEIDDAICTSGKDTWKGAIQARAGSTWSGM